MVYRVFITLIAMLAASVASAQTDFRIGPGDTIRIEVLEDPSLNRDVLVLPDGSCPSRLPARFAPAARRRRSLSSALPRRSRPISPRARPCPSRSRASRAGRHRQRRPRTIDVYIMGEVGTGAGCFRCRRGTTVLQALALSGGFSPFAATKRIQLRRTDPQTGQQTVYNINYRAIEQGASNIGNSVLADGDVIIVPERRLFE
jgi:polysaccharide biosynthesis/export protein